MPKTQFYGYICSIMTTYQQILIILDNFEIHFIGALFPPRTPVLKEAFVEKGENWELVKGLVVVA